MGKNKPTYTSYVDTGDFVVVINAKDIKVSGTKADQKIYKRYTGFSDGQKLTPYKIMLDKHPEEIILHAVHGMLPGTSWPCTCFRS